MSARALPWWLVWTPPILTAYAAMELLSRADALRVLDGLAWALLTLAAVAALVPWSLSQKAGGGDDATAAASSSLGVGVLAGASALHLVAVAAPVQSLFLELASAVLPGLVGALVLSLSLTAPEPPRGMARLRALAPLGALLAVAAGAVGAAVVLAPFELDGETIVLPNVLLELGPGVLLGTVSVASLLRAVRGRLGSGPQPLAQSSLPLLGSITAVTVLVTVGALTRLSPLVASVEGDALRVGWLIAHSALLSGHVALVRGVRPARAASIARASLAAAVTYAVTLAAAWTWANARQFHGVGWLDWAFGLAVGLPAIVLIHRVIHRAVFGMLAPDHGRLLAAIATAHDDLAGAQTLEELAQRVLPALRVASRSPEARPVLVVVTPPCEVTVDAAGVAHLHVGELSPAIASHLRERPGEVILRAPLESQVVRAPQLRSLVEALERLDALAVVALVALGELEGALVVPRGRRRAAVTLEEIVALDRLGARLSGIVASLSAERRAQDRAGAAVLGSARLEQRIEELEDENAALRADAAALKAGSSADRFSQPMIAYGPRMRAFVERAEEVAALDAPVLLRAEPGTALEPIGQLLHAGSARRDGPLVVADALSIQPDRALASMFGGEPESAEIEGRPSRLEAHPGWLRLAQGGTLLLLDVPALPVAVQSALEESIASRSLRGPGGSSAPMDVRVVMTSRVPLAPLLAAGSFDPELARRVEPLTLEVPSLQGRHEDLRSLVLLAIDRGCRALGKPAVGIEASALKALLEHPWTAGTRELEDVVERAVARASGDRITVADLALSAPTTPTEGDVETDGWVGSYTQLETRILEKALERANGNKSEAARALGLKRTTFLDKLRRAGLERATQPPPR